MTRQWGRRGCAQGVDGRPPAAGIDQHDCRPACRARRRSAHRGATSPGLAEPLVASVRGGLVRLPGRTDRDRSGPDVLLRAVDRHRPVPRQLPAALGRRDVEGVRLDPAPLLRRTRRPAGPAGAPLGGAGAAGRADPAAVDHVLHRRLPETPTVELADPVRHLHPRSRRRLERLRTAGRPALRHGSADRPRRHPRHPPGRHTADLDAVRRRVPGPDHPPPLRHPPGRVGGSRRSGRRAAPVVLATEAAAVPRTRTDRGQPGRRPGVARRRSQGRRLVLRRRRCPEPDGRDDGDQPRLAVRAVIAGVSGSRQPTRLVHGVPRRRAPAGAAGLGGQLAGTDVDARRPGSPRRPSASSSPWPRPTRSWRAGSPPTTASTTFSTGRATPPPGRVSVSPA